ncbi:hypothetical protein VM57_11600 [Stenotrophomonas maltophilia]|uniref:Peptidase M14 domain-containing protein n=1 Tax=Stenotrophomonas maltophilia TaxID=40324 RepID=A0A0F5ZQB7_STEMA|nr:hypothetical protein VM57_11600 [Stenotrophomonas maltophilia]
MAALERLDDSFDVIQYGQLDYAPDHYPLFAVVNRDWNPALPTALITGGVHGYETSGVHGALQFLEQQAERYLGRLNLIVAPCVSPWGYERIQRWNPDAIDPNRSFRDGGQIEEAAALMAWVAERNRTCWCTWTCTRPPTATCTSSIRRAAPATASRSNATPFRTAST